jgi:hypothetical protein
LVALDRAENYNIRFDPLPANNIGRRLAEKRRFLAVMPVCLTGYAY